MSRVVIGCRVAMPCSHWSALPTPLFDNISQLLGDSFSVSQQSPIGSFLPILLWLHSRILPYERYYILKKFKESNIYPGGQKEIRWAIGSSFPPFTVSNEGCSSVWRLPTVWCLVSILCILLSLSKSRLTADHYSCRGPRLNISQAQLSPVSGSGYGHNHVAIDIK